MYKIVADSSCDMNDFPGIPFETVPLTLSTDEKSFVDSPGLNVKEVLDYLYAHHGRSYTACPSTQSWLDSFEGADEIYVVTITSGLSGTYASAGVARDQYLSEHPEVKICIVDSLSTGPGCVLLIEKIAELKAAGKSFEEISKEIVQYQKSLKLYFGLQSLHNLAAGGRVPKLVASAIGIMNIRILGTASPEGTIAPIAKCRGDKRVLEKIVEEIKACGYHGGKIRICHVENLALANEIVSKIKEFFGDIDVSIIPARGLCSYYAERGGIILGCER
ncbi:MAG: DegV family protein [Lachnospiraceae bacterium]|nr:DegV family protein [Lachnospiraceae bacterium]MBQ2101323.1 DegV family protein [Lachnospiraceae bacterium]MBQ3906714.1 DegV family protein [Lachnospiraceae bacterium]